MHAHQDAWNQGKKFFLTKIIRLNRYENYEILPWAVLFGAKRWALYPGSPGGVPAQAGYNPAEPHLAWLQKVYPEVKNNPDLAPLECVQRAGDIIYVPEGTIPENEDSHVFFRKVPNEQHGQAGTTPPLTWAILGRLRAALRNLRKDHRARLVGGRSRL